MAVDDGIRTLADSCFRDSSLYNWAANTGSGGYSPWIDGHYFAITSSGTYAYLCQWGSGNHAVSDSEHFVVEPLTTLFQGLIEINTAKGVVSNVCSGEYISRPSSLQYPPGYVMCCSS